MRRSEAIAAGGAGDLFGDLRQDFPHRSGEALHGIDSRLLRVIEPYAKFLDVFASENAPKSHGEPTHSCEIRGRVLQSFDLGRLTRCQ